MQRRKFIAGLGALAGGAGVAMGTGALSATEANRHMTGRVVNDSDAYVSMYGTWENGHYVETDRGRNDKEIALDFSEAGNGDGLNDNAVSHFDNVFHVGIESPADNAEPGDYEFWFTMPEHVMESERIDFYRGQQRDNSLVGKNNRVTPWSGSDGERISVGVTIDLRGADLPKSQTLEDYFGVNDGKDFFTVHVDNKV